MTKSKPRQLRLPFADNSQEIGSPERVDASTKDGAPMHTGSSSQRPGSTPSAATDGNRQLLEAVAAEGNLERALARVVSNRGAAGVDGVSVEAVDRERDRLLPKLRDALLRETYVPGDIRRVWIPKPSGGQRGLGIPTVVDRWVQQAVLQVLEPIYEPTFSDGSHGFRPGRGPRTAIAACKKHVEAGKRWVVDIDLEKFFDQVDHQRLLDRMAQQVCDRRVLRLARLMLKAAVVLPEGVRVSTTAGTPQGGPLSPLLSNIVLSELDEELERRGLSFVRYADDCQIYVGSERAGHRVMASLRRFIERRVRLKVNTDKSAVARSEDRHFLGFRVGVNAAGIVKVELSDRSIARFRARTAVLTRRNWGRPLSDCFEGLRVYTQGWMGHFQVCTREVLSELGKLDAHVRRRIRAMIIVMKKRRAHLLRALIDRGVPEGLARGAAYFGRGAWVRSRSKGLHLAYPNAWFAQRLTPLTTLWQLRNGDTGPLPPVQRPRKR